MSKADASPQPRPANRRAPRARRRLRTRIILSFALLGLSILLTFKAEPLMRFTQMSALTFHAGSTDSGTGKSLAVAWLVFHVTTPA